MVEGQSQNNLSDVDSVCVKESSTAALAMELLDLTTGYYRYRLGFSESSAHR